MDYLPLFTRVRDLPCLVVGGGAVAVRKVGQLRKAGARVTVVAPDLHAELDTLARDGQITTIRTTFTAAQVNDFRFVIAATDLADVNAAVARAAGNAGLFCNVVDDRETSTAIMPAVVDRAPVIIAVSSGGRAPVLATRIRHLLEEQLPARLGKLADFMERWRGRAKAATSSLEARRKLWNTVLDGRIGSLVLDGREGDADELFEHTLAAGDDSAGIAFIVGAGPGDPELLTLKAARALQSADVVLHDRLVGPDILDIARRDAEFISVGKQAGRQSISQDAINTLLVDKVRAGNRVCRLKGGDPFIFGRGGEEIAALEAAGLAWRVIPGITAASGCAAAAGIPLTHRETARSVALATAHTADDNAGTRWRELAGSADTLVAYMAVNKLAEVCGEMMAGGLDGSHPALLIENGTTADERMVRGTLQNLPTRAAAANVGSPALLIVGAVTALDSVRDEHTPAPGTTTTWLPSATAATAGTAGSTREQI